MIIKDIKSVEVKETPHNVDVRVLYDKENAQAVHIELNPGESLKPHITPVDVFFYVLEGKPTIMVGDELQQVMKDQLIESPKNIKHCIYNKTSELVRVLVVKAPKPTTLSRIL
ncbi:MAG: cupin domain-containing protein [Marinilabiliales bacterium]